MVVVKKRTIAKNRGNEGKEATRRVGRPAPIGSEGAGAGAERRTNQQISTGRKKNVLTDEKRKKSGSIRFWNYEPYIYIHNALIDRYRR